MILKRYLIGGLLLLALAGVVFGGALIARSILPLWGFPGPSASQLTFSTLRLCQRIASADRAMLRSNVALNVQRLHAMSAYAAAAALRVAPRLLGTAAGANFRVARSLRISLWTQYRRKTARQRDTRHSLGIARCSGCGRDIVFDCVPAGRG